MLHLKCNSIGCLNNKLEGADFCADCLERNAWKREEQAPQSLSERYPQYYKPVEGMTEVDVYAVHKLFDMQDPSGCLHHASKKLLLSGVRTGGKSVSHDIKEARDTLTRWLQLQQIE